MDEVARVCARLIARATVPRAEVPELDHPALRMEVESRLRQCGLELVTSAYTDHVGLRLSAENADATVLDAATNLGLGADACALVTVLWSRLALQRRTAADTHQVPEGQVSLLPADRRREIREFAPSVHFETLFREFGAQLGGRTRLKGLIGQLRRLGFVSYRSLEAIESGPLLELAIDGEKMIAFVRGRVLNQLLEKTDPESDAETPVPLEKVDAESDAIVRALESADHVLAISDLEHRTGLARGLLDRALTRLRSQNIVQLIGSKRNAKYRLRTEDE